MLLRHAPLLRDMATGALLAALGDVACQKLVEKKKVLNTRRCAAMTIFGGLYIGGICHFVYPWYPATVPAALRGSTLAQGLWSTAVDNAIHTPLFYLPAFYMFTGMFQGDSWADSVETLRDGWWETVSAAWLMWIPFQFLNFTLVPRGRRVLTMQAGTLVWNVIIDFVTTSQRLRTRRSVDAEGKGSSKGDERRRRVKAK